jgi:hypothetical protein
MGGHDQQRDNRIKAQEASQQPLMWKASSLGRVQNSTIPNCTKKKLHTYCTKLLKVRKPNLLGSGFLIEKLVPGTGIEPARGVNLGGF